MNRFLLLAAIAALLTVAASAPVIAPGLPDGAATAARAAIARDAAAGDFENALAGLQILAEYGGGTASDITVLFSRAPDFYVFEALSVLARFAGEGAYQHARDRFAAEGRGPEALPNLPRPQPPACAYSGPEIRPEFAHFGRLFAVKTEFKPEADPRDDCMMASFHIVSCFPTRRRYYLFLHAHIRGQLIAQADAPLFDPAIPPLEIQAIPENLTLTLVLPPTRGKSAEISYGIAGAPPGRARLPVITGPGPKRTAVRLATF